MKGFSPRNLKYMRAFAEAWPEAEFVQAALAQLPWYHQLALLDKLKTPEERRWYAAKAIEHGWSRNVLVMQIETSLLQRCGSAVTNFDVNLPWLISLNRWGLRNTIYLNRCARSYKPVYPVSNSLSRSWQEMPKTMRCESVL